MCVPALGCFLQCFFYLFSVFFLSLFKLHFSLSQSFVPLTAAIVIFLSNAIESMFFPIRFFFLSQHIFPIFHLCPCPLSLFFFLFRNTFHSILFHWFCSMLMRLLLLAISQFICLNIKCAGVNIVAFVQPGDLLLKSEQCEKKFIKSLQKYLFLCHHWPFVSSDFEIAVLGIRFNSLVGFKLILLMTVSRT